MSYFNILNRSLINSAFLTPQLMNILGFDFDKSTLPSAIHLPIAHASSLLIKSSGSVGLSIK